VSGSSVSLRFTESDSIPGPTSLFSLSRVCLSDFVVQTGVMPSFPTSMRLSQTRSRRSKSRSPSQTDRPFLSTAGGIIALIVVPAILGAGFVAVVVLVVVHKQSPRICCRESPSEDWRDPMKYVIREDLFRA
jgi:hypothetical protein